MRSTITTPGAAASVVAAIMATGFSVITVPSAFAAGESSTKAAERRLIERGRYLAKTAGCNDCHTAGYAMSGGRVPEARWLTGDTLGWQGPWGTTYPANLRLKFSQMTEAQWLKTAKTVQYRPPMPWFALHDMNDYDLRAIYHFVRHLGPAGEPAPAYLPPGKAAPGPVVVFPAPAK